ncbi:hypothetical protein KDM90_15190 [Undibacterium sp. FT137W]|uniref:Uncharacterized protein n=2 Tax=Undibacterium fentianense TaxID=2828728 RepID=A0A941EA29_9BURK|nr:hypothetical protein [Undibacterium fentianense]
MHHGWAERAGTADTSYHRLPKDLTLFSEWPVIASHALQQRLCTRLNALCATLGPHLQAVRTLEKGWKQAHEADVLTVDYAIVEDGNGWDIRLVEFQAFTSLLSTGFRLHQLHSDLWPELADCPPWHDVGCDAEWLQNAREWVVGGNSPALLEHQVWQRGTLFDLYATSLLWDVPIVEPHQVEIDAQGRLFSILNGKRNQHDQILNRLILNELPTEHPFLENIKSAQLRWHSHPEWFFLVQKGLCADLKIPFEPRNVRADAWRELGINPEHLVAKKMDSCGGKDLLLSPNAKDLDQLDFAKNWLVQPRYTPYPIAENSQGDAVFAEIRLIVRLDPVKAPWIAMQIVRMYCAEQASASFFKGREGEGATILHTPPSSE